MAEQPVGRIQRCTNPRCTRGPGDTPAEFVSVRRAAYCSDACRQQVRYAERRRERLVRARLVRG